MLNKTKKYYDNGNEKYIETLTDHIYMDGCKIKCSGCCKINEFYEDGMLKATYYENNNVIFGDYVIYFQNGLLDKKMTIKKFYDETYKKNRVIAEQYIENEKKTQYLLYDHVYQGEVEFYYLSGNLHIKANYINDVLHGSYDEYYDSKNAIKMSTNYINGFINGKTVFFDEDGYSTYVEYHRGLKQGKLVKYRPDGNTLMSEMYYNNVLEGAQKYFDVNGKVVKVVMYENGNKIEEWLL